MSDIPPKITFAPDAFQADPVVDEQATAAGWRRPAKNVSVASRLPSWTDMLNGTRVRSACCDRLHRADGRRHGAHGKRDQSFLDGEEDYLRSYMVGGYESSIFDRMSASSIELQWMDEIGAGAD